ncbi:MAG: hypothetical protein ACKVQK_03485 [Burkholderiales bacterium]
MNRQQRRAAAKRKPEIAPSPAPHSPATAPTHEPAAMAKPGFLLRFFAKILLAPWVLKRVRHADMERLLAGVAVQAGKPEIAVELLGRVELRRIEAGNQDKR